MRRTGRTPVMRRSAFRRTLSRSALALLAATAGLVGLGALVQPAGAVTIFTVNSPVDAGLATPSATACVSTNNNCSLRAAIEAANNVAGGVVIDLPANVYNLSLEQPLDVESNITITGLGTSANTQIQQVQPGTCAGANPTGCQQVFQVDTQGIGSVPFSLSNVTVSGGATTAATTPYSNGAGISAGGPGDTTTLTNDLFTNNQVLGSTQNSPGGGVSQQGGDLVVTGCTFTNNSAGQSSGGAIDFESADGAADTLTVTNSTFTNNTSANPSGGGGAIYLDNVASPGTVSATVTQSAFGGNTSTAGTSVATGGGAILVGSGTLDAYSDSFTLNAVSGAGVGGAVNIAGGTTSVLAGDRLVGNTAATATGRSLAANGVNGAAFTANDNWWGVNTGPISAELTPGVTASTYLQLRVSASPSSVTSGAPTTVTADLTHDQNNAAYTTHFIPDGTAVVFGGSGGSYAGGTTASTTNGTATDVMTTGAAGLYPAGVAATVDLQSVSGALTVNGPPSITSANAATFTVGTAGSFTVTTGGYPAPSLSDGGATLPSGVTFTDNGNGTATLSGTPAAGTGGNHAFTITANNGISPNATQTFTLTVVQAPLITSANATSFAVGTHGSFTVTTSTSFPTPPAIAKSGTLPSGVTFIDNGNGTATLSGTPTSGSGGTYPLTITASNGIVPNGTQSFTLTVNEAPSITSAASATFTAGTSGTFTVTTHGFPTTALSDGGATLPTGVTFVDNGNGTATLAGTPAAGTGGVYAFTLTASNGVTPNATQSFTLTVLEAPTITSGASTTFTTGTAGAFTVTTAHAYPNPIAISETGTLPGGVTFVDNGNGTATLAGTPAAGSGGVYTVTITASNGISPNAVQTFTLTVDEAPTITSAANTTFTVGTAGSFTVTTSPSFPTAVSLSDGSATLPNGVTFVDNGNGTATLAGTPAAGTGDVYHFTITASNGVNPDATQTFTLDVVGAPSITSAASTTFTAGTSSTFTVTTGGFPVPSISETGSLPSGVTFVDNGNGTATVAGTPTAGTGGTFPITLSASNGILPNASQSFTLTVNEAPGITSASSAIFTVGTAGTWTVTTSPSFPSPPSITEAGTLPSGVTFTDNGNGTATLAGTPAATTGGVYNLTFTASNGVSPDGTQAFTLTVHEAPTITSAASATFTVGAAGSFTVTTGHAYPLAPSVSETGALPGGVTFVDNGNGTATLSGTPAAGTGGTYTFTVTASNGISPNATQTFTLTVDEAPTITSGAGTTFTVGTAGTFTVTTGHAYPAAPAITEAGALPTGVTFIDNGDGTATLSGTPAAGSGGSYHLTLTADNGVNLKAVQSFILVVDEPPGITSAANVSAAVGQPLHFAVTTSGYPHPTLTDGGATLPSGVSFTDNGNGTATLSGTPNPGSNGTYTLTVTANNGLSPNATQTITLIVYDKLTALAGPFPAATTGVSYNGQLSAVGGKAPYSWSAASLPPGLNLSATTGAVSGTPTSAGTYNVTFTVTDSRSVTASVAVTIRVFAPGLRLAGADGGVFALGGAQYFGSLGGITLAQPIVGIAATPDGQGYWMVGADGGIFNFGDAPLQGSLPGLGVQVTNIVGMAPTPNGQGYWLVGNDGGVFTFGNAGFSGSLPGLGVNVSDVVGIAATSDGGGYWLVEANGGVFAFGDASYHGSMGGRALNKPMVGIVATADGGGYWLVAADGGVFAFGDAPFLGSAVGTSLSDVAGIVPTPSGAGYWLFSAEGQTQTYGDAPAQPSLTGPLAAPIVGGTPND